MENMEPPKREFGRRKGFEVSPRAAAEHANEGEFNPEDYRDSKDKVVQDLLLRREGILAQTDRVADDEKQILKLEELIRERYKSPNQIN